MARYMHGIGVHQPQGFHRCEVNGLNSDHNTPPGLHCQRLAVRVSTGAAPPQATQPLSASLIIVHGDPPSHCTISQRSSPAGQQSALDTPTPTHDNEAVCALVSVDREAPIDTR